MHRITDLAKSNSKINNTYKFRTLLSLHLLGGIPAERTGGLVLEEVAGALVLDLGKPNRLMPNSTRPTNKRR